MLHERTKDSFGKGQDMEMHYGEMCSLPVSLCTPSELEQHHWVNLNEDSERKLPQRRFSVNTLKHQLTNAKNRITIFRRVQRPFLL